VRRTKRRKLLTAKAVSISPGRAGYQLSRVAARGRGGWRERFRRVTRLHRLADPRHGPAKAKSPVRTRCSAPLHRPGLLSILCGPGLVLGGAEARTKRVNTHRPTYGVARDTLVPVRRAATAVRRSWFTASRNPRSQDGRR